MDTQRVILAVVLSLIVIVGWSYFFAPQPVQRPAQDRGATAEQPADGTGATPAAEPAVKAEPGDREFETDDEPLMETFEPVPGREVKVETPLFKAVFTSQGGILKRFELKKYNRTIKPDSGPVNLVSPAATHKGSMGLLINGSATWRKGDWAAPEKDLRLAEGESAELVFKGRIGSVDIIRTYAFDADSYLITENTGVRNTAESQINARLGFTMAATDLTPGGGNRYNRTKVSWLAAEGKDDEEDTDDLAQGISVQNGVRWGAIQTNYFMVTAAPEGDALTLKTKYEDDVYRVALIREPEYLMPGNAGSYACDYYLGPVDDDILEGAPHNLEAVVTYGWFDFISKPLLEALKFFQSFVKNWGVAIIILTLIIKIIFWPLSHKSYKSMNKMKKLQPLMAEIREKHKGDREKMNQEMMRLYKTYKVNPAGGCLPMLLQIPVFIGLYQALLYSIELRHASFISHVPFTDIIWLADLSAKDPFYVTPVIMGATMLLQQKMTPSPGDPTQAKMMMFMPVIFTFIFLTFPAGLVVYWLSNNVLSIAQQWWLLKKS
jgi:YidC/Oxa1 family membrane protein insertase